MGVILGFRTHIDTCSTHVRNLANGCLMSYINVFSYLRNYADIGLFLFNVFTVVLTWKDSELDKLYFCLPLGTPIYRRPSKTCVICQNTLATEFDPQAYDSF